MLMGIYLPLRRVDSSATAALRVFYVCWLHISV